MKKILFVIQSLNTGGAEKSLVNLLNLMDYSKYEVDVVTFTGKGLFFEQLPKEVQIVDTPVQLRALYNNKTSGDKITILKYRFVRYITNGFYWLITKNNRYYITQKRWKSVYSKIIPKLEKKYDIAVAYMHGEAAYFVAEKVQAKKKIAWIHHDYSAMGYDRNFDEKRFQVFDKIVSISYKCVSVFNKIFPDLASRTICLPNLTSKAFTKMMAESEYPKEYAECPGSVKLLSIGRLHEQKGFDLAIDAAKILKEKGISFSWFIIGGGVLKEQLVEQINRNNVCDNVQLLGLRVNPYPYISNCDIFVQSSRYEGKSVVVDEAKILEKPIVCTNYMTVADQIKNGNEGVIVEMNAEGVASGIIQMLSNKNLMNHIIEYLASHSYDNVSEISHYYELF